MTGPEHYREAETLIKVAESQDLDGLAQFTMAEAQVHATLALAAATHDVSVGRYVRDWNAATGSGKAGA